MCEECYKFALDRRWFLSLSVAGIAATSFFSARPAYAAGATTSVTANEAIAKLKAGNEKYVNAPQICAVELSKQREQVRTRKRHGQRLSLALTAAFHLSCCL